MLAGLAKGKKLFSDLGSLCEDGLTSAFIGQLRYLPAHVQQAVITTVADRGCGRVLDLALWPVWTLPGGATVEPDAVILLEQDHCIVVEAKLQDAVAEAQLVREIVGAREQGLTVTSIICPGTISASPTAVGDIPVVHVPWPTFVNAILAVLQRLDEPCYAALAQDIRDTARREGILLEPFCQWAIPAFAPVALDGWKILKDGEAK